MCLSCMKTSDVPEIEEIMREGEGFGHVRSKVPLGAHAQSFFGFQCQR